MMQKPFLMCVKFICGGLKMASMADHDEDLEEGGVELIEGVDVGEEEGEGLLGHRVLFGNLVPEPLRLEVRYRGYYV